MGLYALLVRGPLTIDLGIGRPIVLHVAAPRELVFDCAPWRPKPSAWHGAARRRG